MLAGVLAKHHRVLRDAHVGGLHDLICLGIGDDAVLVDAGLMREGVRADDRLARRDRHARDIAQALAALVDLLGVDARLGLIEVAARLERHDDLLEAGVARALADAVDGALHLRRARLDAGEGVRDGHAEVVVTVDGEVDVLRADDVLTQKADQLRHLLRRGVADGIGDVQRRRTRRDGVGVALGEEGVVGAGRVLGGELDVRALGVGVADHLRDRREHLLARHAQLVLHVDVARGKEDVDAGMPGLLHRVPRGVDVALRAAGEGGDRCVLHDGGDRLDALEVHGGRDGEARLDDVHAELFELAGHLNLLVQVHAAAGRLLTVAKGRVKNLDAFHTVFPPESDDLPAKGIQKRPPSPTSCKRRKPELPRYHSY